MTPVSAKTGMEGKEERGRETETGSRFIDRERRKGEGQKRKEGTSSVVKYISLIYKINVH